MIQLNLLIVEKLIHGLLLGLISMFLMFIIKERLETLIRLISLLLILQILLGVDQGVLKCPICYEILIGEVKILNK